MPNKMGEMRKKKSITQEELAEMVGVSQSAITAYETGVRRPSPEVVNKLMKVFDISVNDAWNMFYGDDNGNEL